MPVEDIKQRAVNEIEQHSLNQILYAQDAIKIGMWADSIRRNDAQSIALKEKLFAFIKGSKGNPSLSQAAANAITVLNYAGVSFSGMDLSYIAIPYADLSGAIFDGTNLACANLTGVRLAHAFLREANLSESLMKEVDFIEKPSLSIGSETLSIIFDRTFRRAFCSKHILGNEHQIIVIDLKSRDTQQITSYLHKSYSYDPSIKQLCLSSCGKKLVSTIGKDFYFFEVTDGPLALTAIAFARMSDEIRAVTFSPDNNTVALGSFNYLQLYDFDKRKSMKIIEIPFELKGEGVFVQGLYFTPDQKYLIAVTDYYSPHLIIYSMDSWEIYKTISFKSADESSIDLKCLTFSPDGQWLAVGRTGGCIHLIKTDTWEKLVKPIETESEDICYAICYSPDNCYLFFVMKEKYGWGPNGYIYAYELANEIFRYKLRIDNSDVISINCLQDNNGYHITIATQNGMIRFFDLLREEKSLMMARFLNEYQQVNNFCIVPSTNNILEIAKNNKNDRIFLRVRDLETGIDSRSLKLNFSSECLCAHPYFSIIAVGGTKSDNNDFVDAFSTLIKIRQANEDHNSLSSLKVSRAGAIRLFDINKWQEISLELEPTIYAISAVVFSADGQYLAYGSKSGEVFIYKISNENHFELIKKIEMHSHMIWSLTFNKDSSLFVIGTGSFLYLYDKGFNKISEHETVSSIIDMDFHPNLPYLAVNARESQGDDNSFSLYSVANNKLQCIFNFIGQEKEIRCVRFIPEKNLIATGAEDGKLIFWEIPNSMKSMPKIVYRLDNYFSKIEYIHFFKGLLLVSDTQSVVCWKISSNSDKDFDIKLQWSSQQTHLYTKSINVENIQGVSKENLLLLKQLHLDSFEENKEIKPPAKRVAEDQVDDEFRKNKKSKKKRSGFY